ncbi:MAG: Rrf2 family transcriptional regulator [Puniceicoccaceae bacterium]
MKLSLKVEYACQVLAQLGYTVNKPELPHIEDLAKAESIPSNYLVQILNELRTAGLITSKRGKQGGYALARNPSEISLYDIMKAVEGEVLAHSPSGEGASSGRTAAIWGEIARQFENSLKEVSVEDFMTTTADEMWYI